MNEPRTDRRIESACRLIERSETPPSLTELARAAGLSPAHFQKLFVAKLGVSPKAYATTLRRGRLSHALGRSSRVTDAIYDAGYAGSSAAYRDSNVLGMAPSRLRRGGAGELLQFASARSSLGDLFIAATARGVCALEFTDAARGAAGLRQRFPNAVIEPGDARLQGWLKALVALVDGREEAPELPLDIRGTAFQARVWRALQRIPSGTTVSYGELARRIHAPRSVRAVASACARNAIAVLVPCHRVVGSNGALTGYRWGVRRKRALLAREAEGRTAEVPPRRRA